MHPLVRQLYQVLGLAYYHVFLGPRGVGRPAPVTTWDSQYRTGHWDYFTSADELPRYAIIASQIRRRATPPSILDVGCGYGELLKHLGPSSLARYLGVDLSSEAIERAKTDTGSHPDISFAAGDFEDWRSDAKFDFIVFNDTLYYAQRPIVVLNRYADMLEDGGSLIVAMYRHRNTMVIWRDIARRFGVVDCIEVRNRKGELTDIRVLRPQQSRAGSNGVAASSR